MKNKLQLLIIMFLIMLSINITAQNKILKDKEHAKELSIKVAELFKENKISQSFNELSPYWPIPETAIDNLEMEIIKNLNVISVRFGKPIGILKVKEEKLEKIVIRETYFVRYQNSAIRLIFTYYKNNEGWLVSGFNMDDSISKEFK